MRKLKAHQRARRRAWSRGRKPNVAEVDTTTTVAPPSRRLVVPERFRYVGQTYGALAGLLLLLLYNLFFTRNFVNAQTVNVNLTQVATTVIVGIGMTLVIATGGIDLSVGALMAISGALAPIIFLSPFPPLNNPAIGIPMAFIVPVLVAGAF